MRDVTCQAYHILLLLGNKGYHENWYDLLQAKDKNDATSILNSRNCILCKELKNDPLSSQEIRMYSAYYDIDDYSG